MIVVLVLKAAFDADVRSAQRAGPAVGTCGERPILVGHARTERDGRSARALRVAVDDPQLGLRCRLVHRDGGKTLECGTAAERQGKRRCAIEIAIAELSEDAL